MIEAEREGTGRALLRIGGKFVFEVAAKGGDEAGGRGHGPAGFECAQPSGHGSSAGVAGNADVLGVYLGPREEVIESADAVPGSPRSEEFADEELLVPGVKVLADTDARPSLSLQVRVLQPLALPDGVEDEND